MSNRTSLFLGAALILAAAACSTSDGSTGSALNNGSSPFDQADGSSDVPGLATDGAAVDTDVVSDTANVGSDIDSGPDSPGVGDGVGGGTGPDTVTPTPDVGSPEPDVPMGYPSDDLMVKILAPGDGDAAVVMGGYAQVNGLLFGDADSITWQSSNGGSGESEVGTYWVASPIALSPGDNVITVTATREGQTASDSIVVTYNPGFRFDTRLMARPSHLWVGSTDNVIFNVGLGIYANFEASSVELLQVDAQGNILQSLGSMADNGNVSGNGDEIQGDGVFSSKESVSCSTPGPLFYRASVQVTVGAQVYKALTSVKRVFCAAHYEYATCQADQQVIIDAGAQLSAGVDPDTILSTLTANALVKTAGRSAGDGATLWVQFQSGVLGAVLNNSPGTRGAGAPGTGAIPSAINQNIHEVGSRTALVLAPFSGEFGSTDDGPQVANVLSTSECPNFQLAGGSALQGNAATLERFRSMSQFGITSISSHGEALFGGISVSDMATLYGWDHLGYQEVVWTGEQVNCGALQQTSKQCTVSGGDPTGGCPSGTVCVVTEGSGGSTSSGTCIDRTQFDLRLGRVVMTNKGYAVTPEFVEAYSGDGFPDSLVNIGACRSMYNGTMSGTLLALGAKAVTGFSGTVNSEWARSKVLEMFEGALGKGQIGSFHETESDPSHPGSWWRLLGAANLDLSRSQIINPSFENGDTTGWRRDGDGRVVSRLGSSSPVDGKFMGLLSTGLGFTVQTGTLEQDFCIEEDRTNVSVYWKFFSEEFTEFCGSQFQDTFQAVLSSAAGEFTVLDLKVDDLCGYGDGSCSVCTNPIACDVNCMGTGYCQQDEATGQCTGVYPCQCGRYFVGLIPSDVSFDVGGVFNVLWQRTTRYFPPQLVTNGKVTMRLYASDTGDSIYDTVILVDDIKFE